MKVSSDFINNLSLLKNKVKDKTPLIHCITNPISINDCANAVLAVGGKPIMAEHPKEVCEITKMSSALAVNIGNITDARIESIMLSGKTAYEMNIKSIIDIVGVGCSQLRLDFSKKFIANCKPTVIKGNISELKTLYGVKADALGIDVGKNDVVNENNISIISDILLNLSKETNAVIIATGKQDLVAYNDNIYTVSNGCEKMSIITGTGCMLNVLIGSFLSVANSLDAVLYAASYFGICGQLSDNVKGVGSFRTELLDNLYLCNELDYINKAKIEIL